MVVMNNGEAAMTCAEYVIQIQPGPGRGNPLCGGASCLFDCNTDKRFSWFWQRTLSSVSPAGLVLDKSGGSGVCCDCVPRKWHDELAFYRKRPGTGNLDLKWIGPVVNVVDSTTEGTLTIQALDRSVWVVAERCIPVPISGITEPAEIRWERLWKATDLVDPVFLELILSGGLSGVTISDDVDQWSELGPQLQKLQAFGVNWSVCGEQVIFGDLTQPLTQALIDPSVHWQSGGANVSDLGDTTVTNVLVQRDEGPVLYPPEIIPDPCDGVHISKVSPDFDLTDEEAQVYARQEFLRQSAQGLQVTTSVDSSLSQEWPIPMCDMKPGGSVTVDVSDESFCLQTQTEAQLATMTVEGVGCKETAVKATLAPQGGVVADL